MCEKSEENRDEWAKKFEKKLKTVEQHRHVEEERKELVQEIMCDVNKNFNIHNNACTHQKLIEYKDLFRGMIVKELVVSNQKRIYFKSYNKLIVKTCIQHYYEC